MPRKLSYEEKLRREDARVQDRLRKKEIAEARSQYRLLRKYQKQQAIRIKREALADERQKREAEKRHEKLMRQTGKYRYALPITRPALSTSTPTKAELKRQERSVATAVKREQLSYEQRIRAEARRLGKRKASTSRRRKRTFRKVWRRLI